MYWWFYSFITEVRYKKITMQRTQQFSLNFVCYRKNPVKCSVCVVSQKNCDQVKNWLLGDTFSMPVSQEPLIRISRNLAGKYFKALMINVKAQLMERDAIFVQSLVNYSKYNAIDLLHVRSLYRSFSSGLNNILNSLSCILIYIMRPVWLVCWITLFLFRSRPHGPCTFHGIQFTIGLNIDSCLPIKEFKLGL